MTRSTVVEAEALRLSDLLGRGRFAVPWHQRYYDWSRANVEELLVDLRDAMTGYANRNGRSSECYFLGALILVQTGQDDFEINDGQQRLVTFSLIAAAFCSRFANDDPDPQREAIALRLNYLLDANSPCSLGDADAYARRLTPPKSDSAAYRQMLRGYSFGSNEPLAVAWRLIKSFVDELRAQEARDFFDYLVGRVEVAVLRIPSEVDPTQVYETVNSRGKPLDDLDRIRNHFYSWFGDEGQAVRRETIHESLERVRTVFPHGNVASTYLRSQLQLRLGFLRADHFYRDAKVALQQALGSTTNNGEGTRASVLGLVEDVAEGRRLELYRKITATEPDPDLVGRFDREAGGSVPVRGLGVLLRELRHYKVAQPIVLALLEKYIQETDGRSRRRVARLVGGNLRRLDAFVLRTAFVSQKFEPSKFERGFAECARRIAMASDLASIGLADFLRECDESAYRVLDDDRFIQELQRTRLRSGPKIRQLLCGVNRRLHSGGEPPNERSLTVEHILPKAQEHWQGWPRFDEVDCRDWVDRIGNLTLLRQSQNRSDSRFNGSFKAKAAALGRSGVELSRRVDRYGEWSPATIEHRTRDLAEEAARVWAFT